MRLDINFLHQHRKALTSLEKKDKKYYTYTLYGAITVTIIACVIAGFSLFLSFSADQVLANRQSLEASILQQEEIERSALVLAAKVGSLAELISQRGDKQQAINYFTDLFSSDAVLIKDIDYQSREGVLQLRIEAQSVFVFEELVDALESEQTQSQFESIAKSELRRTREGAYSIVVTVVLRKNTTTGAS
jgi:hypothetical protein